MDAVDARGHGDGDGPHAVIGPAAEVERTFIAAARAGRMVRLFEEGDRQRLVEPHMVFRSGAGKTVLHVYQVAGYSSQPNPAGWRNLPLERVTGTEVVDRPFEPRPDYNPLNREMFPHVVFAIAMRDGRRREPNAA